MSQESPFTISRIECPVCRTINEIETVKMGSYREGSRDTDFCPTEIIWSDPKYNHINPLLFFTAMCDNCFYTREFTSEYENWKDREHYFEDFIADVKEKHLENYAVSDSIIKKMGQAVNQNESPNESAVLKLHLAIFDELLGQSPRNLDLGRFYLRLAWIYRDLSGRSNPDTKVLKEILTEVTEKLDALSDYFDVSHKKFNDFSFEMISHFDSSELAKSIRENIFPYKADFEGEFVHVKSAYRALSEKIEKMKEMTQSYKDFSYDDDSVTSRKFAGYSDFQEFLKSLKGEWDGIVLNEQEALRKSVSYYLNSYEGCTEFREGNQQVQLAYLIGELSRMIGENEQAKAYFNESITLGQQFIKQQSDNPTRTIMTRKILEMAVEQGKFNNHEVVPTEI